MEGAIKQLVGDKAEHYARLFSNFKYGVELDLPIYPAAFLWMATRVNLNLLKKQKLINYSLYEIARYSRNKREEMGG